MCKLLNYARKRFNRETVEQAENPIELKRLNNHLLYLKVTRSFLFTIQYTVFYVSMPYRKFFYFLKLSLYLGAISPLKMASTKSCAKHV